MSLDEPDQVFERLFEVLQQRKHADADSSYVASLYAKGLNKILEKVGEESTEFILAAKDHERSQSDDSQSALVGETADLWFHSMVALSKLDIHYTDVLAELERRFGLSGLDEKAARSQNDGS